MKIYIAGISGTGLGPLALMAKAAGATVYGSDTAKGAIYDELVKSGIEVAIGPQDGQFLQSKLKSGLDWYVHTSAMKETHPEVAAAEAAGIRVSKRDELTAYLVDTLKLKMVAVAGTHGKTTTTAMIVYAALKLHIPVSYIVGTTLGFAPSGAYQPGSQFFIYEADEYDRNFLKFHPWLSVIPYVSYDHPDIYPTKEDYQAAFQQFEKQSERVIAKTTSGLKWRNVHVIPQCNNSALAGEGVLIDGISPVSEKDFQLAGTARRVDASLAALAIHEMAPGLDMAQIIATLNDFPGVGRRFEKLADGLYTDYAHHPEEIKATIDVALDAARLTGKKGVVVVYQPHQNTRQHEVCNGYKDAFLGASKIYWLPTYLTRENPALPVLSPAELISILSNSAQAEVADLDDALCQKILSHRDNGELVVLMTAGPGDSWLREKIQ